MGVQISKNYHPTEGACLSKYYEPINQKHNEEQKKVSTSAMLMGHLTQPVRAIAVPQKVSSENQVNQKENEIDGVSTPKKNNENVYLIPPDQKESRQSFHSFNCCTVNTCAEFNPKTPSRNVFTNLSEYEKEKVLKTSSLKKPHERLNGRNLKHEWSDHNVTFCNNVKCGVDEHGHKTVNHYVILKHVGQGTHGDVFLCFDSVTRKNMAIKILRKSVLKRIRSGVRGNNNELNKVLRSIAIMKKLNHENVIKLLEVIDDPTQDKMFEGINNILNN